MPSFPDTYRAIFSGFGYPLTEKDAGSPSTLAEAESRLGARVPLALREYYLVAGRDRRFNSAHNRLLPPTKWEIDQKRLLFMQESQSVCVWGVSVRNPHSDDPPVSQGIEDESILCSPEHRKCSVWLAVMLCFQAVSGGFRHLGSGNRADPSPYQFEPHGWTFQGEVNALRAYTRPNQVVCVAPPSGLPFAPCIMAAAKTRRDFEAVAIELGLSLQ